MARASSLSPASKPMGERALTGPEKAARWRAANPARAKQVRDNQRQRNRALIAEHKAKHGCRRCGIRDPRVLDLHHRDGEVKVMAVSQMYARSSIADMLAEIAKCEVLCANCHRIEHHEETARAPTPAVTLNLLRAS